MRLSSGSVAEAVGVAVAVGVALGGGVCVAAGGTVGGSVAGTAVGVSDGVAVCVGVAVSVGVTVSVAVGGAVGGGGGGRVGVGAAAVTVTTGPASSGSEVSVSCCPGAFAPPAARSATSNGGNRERFTRRVYYFTAGIDKALRARPPLPNPDLPGQLAPLRTRFYKRDRHNSRRGVVMDWIAEPNNWIALATLTVLELVLGIDNIIFISILAGKLPAHQQNRARVVGLSLAMITRILMLMALSFLAHLTTPLLRLSAYTLSGRDLILLLGGLFLLAKSTQEIHDKLEGAERSVSVAARPGFRMVIGQIILLDIVFSIDSVITAVGMVDEVAVMAAAVIIAVILMMLFAGPLGRFVDQHPTVKMLALSFLLLIGAALIADGLHFHIPRGYVYFAMGFSVMVEMLNLRLRKPAAEPVHLHAPIVAHDEGKH